MNSRIVKHFVFSIGNGTFTISRAKEVVPNRMYEVYPKATSTTQTVLEKELLPLLFFLGESLKKKSSLQ